MGQELPDSTASSYKRGILTAKGMQSLPGKMGIGRLRELPEVTGDSELNHVPS